MTVGEEIRIRGLVQGVGFRPAVWREAQARDLVGSVRNDGDGVLIRIWGEPHDVDGFVRALRPPPLARIDALERRPLDEPPSQQRFEILPSAPGPAHTAIPADTATCMACVEETLGPGSRRHGYPFTNCTHCGPRLTIVGGIPYDRARTSLAGFGLCAQCEAEYGDPSDRRFHAQPVACPCCGPRVWIESDGAVVPEVPTADVIPRAREMLLKGSILAIKGLGGFHLACDATNAAAVARLRERKHRARKAFALMARDAEIVARYCKLSEADRKQLASPAAPIVLCEASGPRRLPEDVAPGLATLGFMLPYTPLHWLLLQDMDRPIVLTSGNGAESPQCIDNGEARARLAGVADAFLMHDREIVNRVDDSVVRVSAGAPRMLRRARGFAPSPISLARGFERAPSVLAMGGELKNTFCLVKDGNAYLSQHQGGLDDVRTLADYRRNVALYARLFTHEAQLIAVDLHPQYLSTTVGAEWADRAGVPLVPVAHHHAHVASCLAENGVALDAPPVLGIALDGLGMGENGEWWGGEFLYADYRGFRRLARFRPMPLPGGDRAAAEPWRNAYAHIDAAMGAAWFGERYGQLPLAQLFERKSARQFDRLLTRGEVMPRASSCGRLFDAVAAAVGVCADRAAYEGQPAMELEALASRCVLPASETGYPFRLPDDGALIDLDAGPMWRCLVEDLAEGTDVATIAARFHRGLAIAIVDLAHLCARDVATTTIVLTGGVFQNGILLEQVSARLSARGHAVLMHGDVPAGDGGLALGQAAVASARALAGESGCA
jgi:hydrogenase maturation protein HypF